MAAAPAPRSVFGTSGIRGSFDRVSPALALRFGAALATRADRVVVARDGRLSGPALERALVAGLASGAADVERVGRLPTHALAWASRDRDAHGVMVTASHNPPEDNGLKLFGPHGREARPAVEAAVEDAMDDAPTAAATAWGAIDERAADRSYLDAAVRHVAAAGGGGAGGGDHGANDGRADETGEVADGLSVAVDCANGVGAVTTPPVLRRLGAHVVTVNAQIDGTFPGRDSKPTPESLAGFRELVADRFDVGIAHDGDADRTVVVAPDGALVPEDGVLAVLARDAVAGSDADEPLVLTTPNASSAVDDAVEDAGGRIERVRLGGLPEAMAGADDLAFAAEPWKHVFPRFGPWVDGTITAARVVALAAAAGGADALFADVMDVSVDKRTVSCPDDAKAEAMARVEDELLARHDVAIDRTDGLRFDFADGRWLLVRPSGTEPLIRVYGEGDAALVDEAMAIVEDAVERA